MSESTYDALKLLLVELSHAQSADESSGFASRAQSANETSRLLKAVLDAHVIEPTGVGTYTLEGGETVYDPEDMLAVGVSLAHGADAAVNAVPLEWLEVAPSAARLHVLAWLLPTLWSTWSPPAEHVGRLLDAFESVAPADGETSRPLLGVLLALGVEGELAARIRALEKATKLPALPSRSQVNLRRLSALKLDPNLEVFAAALSAETPRERASAAGDLDDLLRGDVHPDDLARVVAALLQGAASETDPHALESMLNTLGEAANRPDSGQMANWDPLVPFLQTLGDPDNLGHVLNALGLARHERYRAAIEPFLTHTQPIVRQSAKDALAELDHAKERR